VFAHICNPSLEEAEAGLRIGGQPMLYSEIFSQKQKRKCSRDSHKLRERIGSYFIRGTGYLLGMIKKF
jgi:hypothetical protein